MTTKRKLIIASGALLVAGIAVAISVTHQPTLATHKVPQVVAGTPNIVAVAADVNNERVKAGEAPLVEDTRLDASAAAKCADMASNGYFAHVSPNGTRWDSFIRIHYTHYLASGENLSGNYTDSQAAVTGWMNSPGHRANILNAKFTEVGYALCNVNQQYKNVIVQQFVGE